MNKLVTICIPTFNSEETIEDTIISIINQTYKNIEIKVFDNCSTDSTVQIITKLKSSYSNIELKINDSNIGGEANFTQCLQNSAGDYSGIFHADDIYLPTIIEEQVSVLNNNPDVVATATNAVKINSKGKVIGKRFWPYELKKTKTSFLNFDQLFKLTLKYSNFVTCPTVLARSEVYKNNISTWNGQNFKTSADLDVWLRLAQLGKFALISKPLINYRVDTQSYSFNLKKVRTNRHDMFLVLDHYKNKEIHTSIYQYYYDFLLLKDDALRSYNLMKKKEKTILFNPFKFNYLKIAFKDLKHLREFSAILVIFFLVKIKGIIK